VVWKYAKQSEYRRRATHLGDSNTRQELGTPGRYNMLVLLVGDPERLIEEPARVTIVE
jgi:hypothetical protein